LASLRHVLAGQPSFCIVQSFRIECFNCILVLNESCSIAYAWSTSHSRSCC
jgi:hypothetical protein